MPYLSPSWSASTATFLSSPGSSPGSMIGAEVFCRNVESSGSKAGSASESEGTGSGEVSSGDGELSAEGAGSNAPSEEGEPEKNCSPEASGAAGWEPPGNGLASAGRLTSRMTALAME